MVMTLDMQYDDKVLLKETLKIAWPAVLESFFVSLAGMIDTFMVASLGTYAISAVGLTSQPKYLSYAFFMAANIAVSALVARRKGQQNRQNANEIFLTCFLLTIIGCIVISFITVQFASGIMHLCGSEPETHNYAVDYFILHDFFQIAIEAYPDEWKKVIPISNSIPHILLLRLFDKYDDAIWKNTCEMTPFHKLTYKYQAEQENQSGTYYDVIIRKHGESLKPG